jgi:DNA-binding NarL/FixJ family response regulator
MPTTSPLTVFLAEDDPDIVELMRFAVAGQPDFELVATTGEAAAVLDLVRQHHPDVVILDHRLSDPETPDASRRRRGVAVPQTGLELVEGARAVVPDATIVIFTGRRGLRTAAVNAGADAYVEKPALEEVWSAIRDARVSATSSGVGAERK